MIKRLKGGLVVTSFAFWPAVCPCGCVGRTGPESIFGMGKLQEVRLLSQSGLVRSKVNTQNIDCRNCRK